MAGSVNKVILVGNLGRDPEVRSSQDGNKIVNFSVATSENWRDRQSGERRKRPNGTGSSSSTTAWPTWRNASCARARRSIWKASCRPANGLAMTVRSATPPKWSWAGSGANCRCSTAAAAMAAAEVAATNRRAIPATTVAARVVGPAVPVAAWVATWTMRSRSEAGLRYPACFRKKAPKARSCQETPSPWAWNPTCPPPGRTTGSSLALADQSNRR